MHSFFLADIPAGVPLKLETPTFYSFAPGLATKYPAMQMNIAFEVPQPVRMFTCCGQPLQLPWW